MGNRGALRPSGWNDDVMGAQGVQNVLFAVR